MKPLSTILVAPYFILTPIWRVEAIGPAIIQGVTASKVDLQEPENTSPLLEELKDKRLRAVNTVERYKKTLKAIDTYIDKLNVEHLDISALGKAMDIYNTTEEGWENKITLVEKEIVSLDKKIEEEKLRLEKQVGNKRLRTQIVVGLYAETAGEVEIIVIYGTSGYCDNSTLILYSCVSV